MPRAMRVHVLIVRRVCICACVYGASIGVVQQYAQAQIPLDTIWNDIDYMSEYEDFTWDPTNYPPQQVSAFVQQLHAQGQRYVVIVDPGIHVRQG